MADGVPITAGTGTTIATDDTGATGHVQLVKLAYSGDGVATLVTADGNGLKVNASGVAVPVTDNSGSLTVDDGNGSLTVDGTVGISGSVAVTGTFYQATQPVSGTVTANAGTGPFPVSDNAGSLTVDAPVGTPVYVRLSDGTTAIATLPVSLASVPSHAVTNAGTFAVQAAQSGTWTVQPGNTANTTAWKVDASSVAVPITDNGGSLTVDGSLSLAGASNIANGQVSPTSTAGTLVASRAGRLRLILYNAGTITVYVGAATVTTSTGLAIDPGASLMLATSALVQGITASGTGTIHYIEEY